MRSINKSLLCPLALAVGTMGSVSVMAADPTVVDVMIVYSQDTAKQNKDISAKLSELVNYANTSYKNSNINIELRLVHHSALPKSEELNGKLVGESLNKLSNSEYVADLRVKHGADFVTLVGQSDNFCGIAWLGSHNGQEGRFSSSSKSRAYSLVDIDCTSSYAHELGHNMGLDHSRVQDQEAERKARNNPDKSAYESYKYWADKRIFNWAFGHGVQDQFVTTMAYQSAYRQDKWVPRLQYFSNPNVYECKGISCGVETNRVDSANAAMVLNHVADQLADFMPTKHPIDIANQTTATTTNTSTTNTATTNTGTTNTGTTNTGTTNTGITVSTRTVNISNKTCKATEVPGNFIKNSGFSNGQNESWYASYASYLNVETLSQSCGSNDVLTVLNDEYGAAAYTKLEGLKFDERYDVSASIKLKTDYNTRTNALFYLLMPGKGYIKLKSQSVTNREFTRLKAQFTLKQSQVKDLSDEAYLFVYVPRPGISFMMDDVVFKKNVSKKVPTVVKKPELLKSDFESGLQSWHSGFSSKVSVNFDSAQGGYFSLAVKNRPYWYSGAVYDVKGIIKSGQAYKVKANFKVTSQAFGNQYADMRLYYIDDSGHHWVTIKRQQVSLGQWHTFEGNIKIALKGTVRYQKLFIFGPEAGVNFSIDNVQITQ